LEVTGRAGVLMATVAAWRRAAGRGHVVGQRDVLIREVARRVALARGVELCCCVLCLALYAC
jgi:hypothetical protein